MNVQIIAAQCELDESVPLFAIKFSGTFDQEMDKERTKRTCGGLIIGQRQQVLW